MPAGTTFEFDEGVSQIFSPTVGAPPTPGQVVNLEDGGVKFTFSVTGQARGISIQPGVSGGRIVGSQDATQSPVFTLDVTGFTTGAAATSFSGIVAVNITSIGGNPVAITFHDKFGVATVVKNLTAAGVATAPGGKYSHITFTQSTGSFGYFRINDLTVGAIACFCAGTRIATPDGVTPVEALQPGDRVRTANGGTTTVKWLGEQPIDIRLSHPAKVNPIRITAGALGDGLPTRDLLLSADHAIAIDGLLINAGALVNGQTIHQVRDMPLDGFTYYHIETEGGHELILAEGVAAESFIDYADTGSFANADERSRTEPIAEMPLPRISSARLVPQAVRARLARPRAA